VVQGAEALPRIQPADGWEGVKGSGSPPFVVMERRCVPGIQPADGWAGVEGEGVASPRGVQGQGPRRTQTLVCISAPFGLPIHAVRPGIGL
jgi:hypothetical protein